MPELIIRSGRHDGKRLILPAGDTLIGRGDECQLRLTSPEVSKLHCLLRLTPDGLSVRDLGSSNGTFVNDQSIVEETPLHAGDRLRVGPMIFQIPLHKPSRRPVEGTDTPSDDDISAWLTDDGPQRTGTGDTTIIPGQVAARAAEAARGVTEPAPPNPDRPFQGVAEEAADIIRRWQALQKSAGRD